MNRFLFLALLACLSATATHAQAQDITLDKLVHLASLPANLTPTRNQEAALGEWVFHPVTAVAQDEPLTWGWWPPADAPGTLPGALLYLRPNHGTLDVVLHLRRAANFNQLHREMLRLKAAATPVTCLGCTGERFTTPAYSICFYMGKPEPFPFVVVLHRGIEAGATQPAPANHAAASRIPTP